MQVEVVYANASSQFVVSIEVAENACVEDAIRDSGVLEKYPEISLANNRVGIFSELVCLHTRLKAHDRVEIYRPLKLDPMQARRMRAKM